MVRLSVVLATCAYVWFNYTEELLEEHDRVSMKIMNKGLFDAP